MPTILDADPQLLGTLVALGEYLEDMVLVGGWVPHLYRKIWSPERPVRERRTLDLDAAVRGRVPVRQGSRLDVLLAAEGYAQRLAGPSGLAAQIYESPPNSNLLPIEFLAPLTGPREQATVEIQKGVTAQALRYLNILLDNSFDIRLSGQALPGPLVELTVRIPTPGAYILHRGLIHARGRSSRRGKDLYYIYETWATLPGQRGRIVTEIERLRTGYPRWYSRFRSDLDSLFSSSVGEGVLLVFGQYEAQEPTEMAQQRIYQAFRALVDSLPNE